jgi:hypothetical protein
VKSPLTYLAAFGCAALVPGGTLTAEPTAPAAKPTPAAAKPTPPSAEPTAISLRVEQANTSDMNPKDRITRTHVRKLHVFVTNNSGDQLELKVKYEVFGRDKFTHDVVKVTDGEQPLEVKPHSGANVDSVEAKSVSNEQHWDPKAKKMIDPSGATIIGSGVQVLVGDKLLAEWYDPVSLKDEWGKAPSALASKPATPPAKPAATPAKPKGMLASK